MESAFVLFEVRFSIHNRMSVYEFDEFCLEVFFASELTDLQSDLSGTDLVFVFAIDRLRNY